MRVSQPVNPGDYYCFSVCMQFSHHKLCATRVAAGHKPDFSNSFDTWIKRLEWHCVFWLMGHSKKNGDCSFQLPLFLIIHIPFCSLPNSTHWLIVPGSQFKHIPLNETAVSLCEKCHLHIQHSNTGPFFHDSNRFYVNVIVCVREIGRKVEVRHENVSL